MTNRSCWALLLPLAFTALACPTRTVYYDGGSDMTGGAGGGAGHKPGGSAGGGGVSGAAGSVPAGDAGHAGTAGAAGANPPVGGSNGAAGTRGSGGVAGEAGAAGPGGAAGQAATGGAAGGAPPKAKDGDRCALATDCASGKCTPFYVDIDGDTYGAGQAVGFCGTTPPVGYAAQTGDCCDTATNLAIAKLIHPGADFQTTSAGGICNITWDYDCSGAIEKNWHTCGSCTAVPDCACVYEEFPDSACGGNQGASPCSFVQAGPAQQCIQVGGAVGPVTCR